MTSASALGELASASPAATARLAKTADVAIVFVNQPSREGNDLASLSLPGNQDALVSAVAAANLHTVVVLETGGAVTMPWIDSVSAAVEAWFPGSRAARRSPTTFRGREPIRPAADYVSARGGRFAAPQTP